MEELDWKKNLENSFRRYEIPKSSSGEYLELGTDSGKPLIQVCIDAESDPDTNDGSVV